MTLSTQATPAEEVFKSLTGYDEVAILRAFGEDLSQLRTRPFMFMRTLVFILNRRAGMKDQPAHLAAMTMTVDELTDYFPRKVTEALEEEPVTDEGKETAP